ncbi:Uncharacterised protein [Shigella flexneri]|nr:Uncharacterised protein [Shigella flexneri]
MCCYARRCNLGEQCLTNGIRSHFITNNNNTGDIGFFGPAGGDLTVNQTVVDTRKANNHVVVWPHWFCRSWSRFWCCGSGCWRGFFNRFGFQCFHAFTACFYCQRNQFIKARVIITGH